MTALDEAKGTLALFDDAQMKWDDSPVALRNALADLIAAHECVLAHPLLATVDRDASVVIEVPDDSPVDGEHGAGHDRSCVCWRRRHCGCYLWDQDCPEYAPPTDDECEALADLIAEERDKWPRRADDMDSGDLAEAILAAGFRRQGPITDAQLLAALNAYDSRLATDNLDHYAEEHRADMRAALEAALKTITTPEGDTTINS